MIDRKTAAREAVLKATLARAPREERCTKCGRERPRYISDPTCRNGPAHGYCDYAPEKDRELTVRFPTPLTSDEARRVAAELREIAEMVDRWVDAPGAK